MLANYECDLHGHTNRSDGNDSPVEYIRHAVHRGVKILAITDHDIVPPEMIELGGGKRQEITAYAKGIGVELLRGIEISCETYIDDVHLVCLGCDWNAPYFKEFFKIIYVFLTIFLYLLKCPQSLILSALRAFCFCGKSHIPRSIFLYFRYQSWLKSW